MTPKIVEIKERENEEERDCWFIFLKIVREYKSQRHSGRQIKPLLGFSILNTDHGFAIVKEHLCY